MTHNEKGTKVHAEIERAFAGGLSPEQIATYARGGGKTLETARRVDEARAASFSTLVIGPDTFRPAPISTLLPIGLPPISVQEILAAKGSPLEALRDCVDDAVEAFLERDRAALAELLRWICETCRNEREWAGPGSTARPYYSATALVVWRLYRETPAT